MKTWMKKRFEESKEDAKSDPKYLNAPDTVKVYYHFKDLGYETTNVNNGMMFMVKREHLSS